MRLKNNGEKPISALTPKDFADHPIWSWAEDEDEAIVGPVAYPGYLPENHDALFVAGDIYLSDGTKIGGVASVRMRDHFVYLLSFPKDGERFFDYPIHPQLESTVSREQFASWLGKSTADVFPLMFKTPYVFIDGQLLTARIE